MADALIEHLAGTFDVQVSDKPSHTNDFIRPQDFVRVTRVTPAIPTAAPLTFGFTAYPGVIVHAGLLHDFCYPVCGCDACDDTAIGQAEGLEQDVLAVAAGNYRESYATGEELPVSYSLTRPTAGRAGGPWRMAGRSTIS